MCCRGVPSDGLFFLLVVACVLLFLRPAESALSSGGGVRRLVGDNGSPGGDTWTLHREKCGRADYNLHLSIGIHFYLYAEPVQRAPDSDECRPLMLHADSSGADGKAKDVFEVDVEDLSPTFFEAEALSLGTFRFQDIADAFDAIDVDAAGEKEYNIVTNNCAVLILSMMRALGIQLSPEDRAVVVGGLVAADKEAGNKLATYVRESGEIERSLGLSVDATDEQLLERLTLRQIALALDAEPAGRTYSTGLLEAASQQRLSPGGARSALRNNADGTQLDVDAERNLIVGGTVVTTQEFPFFVQSEETGLTDGYWDLPMCGAVLVAPDVILTTAGYCYETFQWSRRVMVGSFILSNPYGGAEWRNIVSDIIVHPKYKAFGEDTSYPEYTYDFAMMKIEAVTLPNLTSVVLNSDGAVPTNQENLTTVGYGRISDSGSYAPAPGLRKTTFKADDSKCGDFDSFQASVAMCALGRKSDACLGDFGGPLLDSNLTLVGLYSSGKACGNGSPNLFSRVSGSIDWIHETICKLSDFRANYTFCPSVVCPVDLTLLGERNSTVAGGAALPAVTGSMMTPPQDTVVQSPTAGTLIRPGKYKTVTVVATDSNNQTTNCSWVVRVPPIKRQSQVQFTAKRRNSTAVQVYTLDVPFAGNYYYVEVDAFKVLRTKNAVINLTFKRVDQFNRTDSTLLQTFKLKGNKKDNFTFNVTAQVSAPDNSSYLYVAYFSTKGVTSNGEVTYYLYGQTKKM